ncbi:MAG: hypothetical protein A2Z06_00190 [Candidatus Glassbacteria bacterium RBG_16_58_8]|uniref:Capsular polysaccharide assembling protein CapF C-terminal domain-containing protein n=1 Tax=Candidatus Glassbacteria bacterium RBG_16_58_8 TaxID=1817866 RepID=A0A1F5YCL0_9BACT|nr:MAG: hypothetical protein A2Z06_00190 [Candidatus Glassbacteria bacterium RBG_16_58_8]
MIRGVIVREAPYSEDSRGWLLKALPKAFIGGSEFGEIYLSGARPGETKGIHYHDRTTEWFCVIQGEGTLYLDDIESGETMTVRMSRAGRISVEIPPRVAHAIRNEGDQEMILLAFANIPYDPGSPDTFPWKFPTLNIRAGNDPSGP